MAHRLWPDTKLSCALSHAYALRRVQDHAGTQRQLLWRRMGSYQLFQRLALLGRNDYRIGSQ